MNSRPLTFFYQDPDSLLPLTPNHFLLNLSPGAVSKMIFEIPGSREALLGEFSVLERFRESLRVRWMNEYLLGLRETGKWKLSTLEPSVGEVVLLVDDEKKRHVWQLVRIVQLMRGKDGSARVARVKGTRGTFVRPVRKLYPLEVPLESKEEPPPGTSPVPFKPPESGKALGQFEEADSSKGAVCRAPSTRRRRPPARYRSDQ